MKSDPRYLDLNTYLRSRFGCRVQKVPLDAGLTCPNRDGTKGIHGCAYCNARGSGTGRHRDQPSIREQLREGIRFGRRRYKAVKFLAYFQSFSNTYAPLPVLRDLYEQALSEPDVVGLCIGTRPDCVDEGVLDLIGEVGRDRMIWMEYGLQSAWDHTLNAIGRGHKVEDFSQAVRLTRQRGLLVCAHVILGLPGETREHVLHTAGFCARCGIDGIKFHHLYVVRNTPLEEVHRSGEYHPLPQDLYVRWVVDFMEMLPPSTVIQRLSGDPDPAELIAPEWSLDKAGTRNGILRELERRNSRQGIRWT